MQTLVQVAYSTSHYFKTTENQFKSDEIIRAMVRCDGYEWEVQLGSVQHFSRSPGEADNVAAFWCVRSVPDPALANMEYDAAEMKVFKTTVRIPFLYNTKELKDGDEMVIYRPQGVPDCSQGQKRTSDEEKNKKQKKKDGKDKDKKPPKAGKVTKKSKPGKDSKKKGGTA